MQITAFLETANKSWQRQFYSIHCVTSHSHWWTKKISCLPYLHIPSRGSSLSPT